MKEFGMHPLGWSCNSNSESKGRSFTKRRISIDVGLSEFDGPFCRNAVDDYGIVSSARKVSCLRKQNARVVYRWRIIFVTVTGLVLLNFGCVAIEVAVAVSTVAAFSNLGQSRQVSAFSSSWPPVASSSASPLCCTTTMGSNNDCFILERRWIGSAIMDTGKRKKTRIEGGWLGVSGILLSGAASSVEGDDRSYDGNADAGQDGPNCENVMDDRRKNTGGDESKRKYTASEQPPKTEIRTYSGKFLEDNGIEIVTDDTGRVTAKKITSVITGNGGRGKKEKKTMAAVTNTVSPHKNTEPRSQAGDDKVTTAIRDTPSDGKGGRADRAGRRKGVDGSLKGGRKAAADPRKGPAVVDGEEGGMSSLTTCTSMNDQNLRAVSELFPTIRGQSSSEQGNGNGGRKVVVDDNAKEAELLQQALGRMGGKDYQPNLTGQLLRQLSEKGKLEAMTSTKTTKTKRKIHHSKKNMYSQSLPSPLLKQQRKLKPLTEIVPKMNSTAGGFNVVLTHCTADFDTLASAVGLARLWSSPHKEDDVFTGNMERSTNDTRTRAGVGAGAGAGAGAFDDYDERGVPTYVVLPRGAHPTVQKFLALHKHLFPIRSLRSLPTDLTGLNRLGLVDAQRRDRIGPAENLLEYANRVTVVDHHIDTESDIPEATDYVVDDVGSVSTMVIERLQRANVDLTEAEATLLALGVHADTGSLCYDSTTPRDARALAWTMEQGASQAAIAENVKGSLSAEQQGVLTQALINTNSSVIHGVTVSTVLLSAEGFINGLAAVTQDALELSSSDVLLLAVVYDAKSSSSKKKKRKANNNVNGAFVDIRNESRILQSFVAHEESPSVAISSSAPNNTTSSPWSAVTTQQFPVMYAEAWKGGEEALRRRRLMAAFEKRDVDGSGFLETGEISAALASSGVIVSEDSITAVINDIDTDGDGKINFDEFDAFVTQAEKHQREQNELTGHKASTMIIIGRARTGVNVKAVNLNKLLQQFGGGGHAKAASATVRLGDEGEAGEILQMLVDEIIDTSLMEQPTVRDFMTAPVLSAKPTMTEKQVEDLFTRYDVRALPVVDDENNVIGLVTYKEVAAAKQRLWNKEQRRLQREAEGKNSKKGQRRLPDRGYEGGMENKASERKLGSALKGWMKQHVRTVEESMTMSEVEAVLLENDVGCIPVVANGTNQLLGMVTRTDLLRQHRYYPSLHYHNKGFADSIAARKPIVELRKRLKRFDLENE